MENLCSEHNANYPEALVSAFSSAATEIIVSNKVKAVFVHPILVQIKKIIWLTCFVKYQIYIYTVCPWRGANLGGWFFISKQAQYILKEREIMSSFRATDARIYDSIITNDVIFW